MWIASSVVEFQICIPSLLVRSPLGEIMVYTSNVSLLGWNGVSVFRAVLIEYNSSVKKNSMTCVKISPFVFIFPCLFDKFIYLFIYIYIYIYIYIRGSLNKFPDFFVWALLLIVHIWNTPVSFEVTSSGCNAFVLPFQQLLEGPMEVLLCEYVDLRHSLFHLINYLIATASELRG